MIANVQVFLVTKYGENNDVELQKIHKPQASKIIKRGFIRFIRLYWFANVKVFLVTKYGAINGAQLQKNTQTTGVQK